MIRLNLETVMKKRKMGVNTLAEKVGITPVNLSVIKNAHARSIRFSTLDALCKALDCTPGDILEYVPEPEE